MAWHATLDLRFRHDGARSIVFDRHDGPLRVLKSLHPEAGVCQSVIVHPPGGVVGGDTLAIGVAVEAGAHAQLTTPGATRWYRSAGEAAQQTVALRVADGARLEWLPLESIAYDGCVASSDTRLSLAPGGEAIGWDVLALGLPASDRPYERGRFRQTIAVDDGRVDRWLDRGTVDAADRRRLASPLGWAGRRVLATLWFAAGHDLDAGRRQSLVDAARAACTDGDGAAAEPEVHAGASAVDPRVVVVRVLAQRVEQAMSVCTRVWAAWRREAWSLDAVPPRVWRT